jgi:hypothetical protein
MKKNICRRSTQMNADGRQKGGFYPRLSAFIGGRYVLARGRPAMLHTPR